jgi:hypothetical protein
VKIDRRLVEPGRALPDDSWLVSVAYEGIVCIGIIAAGRAWVYPEHEHDDAVTLAEQCGISLAEIDDAIEAGAHGKDEPRIRAQRAQLLRHAHEGEYAAATKLGSLLLLPAAALRDVRAQEREERKAKAAAGRGTTPEAIEARRKVVAANPSRSLAELAAMTGVSRTTIATDRDAIAKESSG